MHKNPKDYTTRCLYCDGYDYHCQKYTPTTSETNEACLWYKTMEHDLSTLIEGSTCITFDKLEYILKKKGGAP